jgi:hypothetical protein
MDAGSVTSATRRMRPPQPVQVNTSIENRNGRSPARWTESVEDYGAKRSADALEQLGPGSVPGAGDLLRLGRLARDGC